MSYLRFEKAVMTNLEESLRRELLRTNRSGAYSLFPYLSWTMRTMCCSRRSIVR